MRGRSAKKDGSRSNANNGASSGGKGGTKSTRSMSLLTWMKQGNTQQKTNDDGDDDDNDHRRSQTPTSSSYSNQSTKKEKKKRERENVINTSEDDDDDIIIAPPSSPTTTTSSSTTNRSRQKNKSPIKTRSKRRSGGGGGGVSDGSELERKKRKRSDGDDDDDDGHEEGRDDDDDDDDEVKGNKKRRRVVSPSSESSKKKKSEKKSREKKTTKKKSNVITIVDSEDDDDYFDMKEEVVEEVVKGKTSKKAGKTKKETKEGEAQKEENTAILPPVVHARKWYEPRGFALNKGSKEIPLGKPGCLTDKNFCITGQLESLEREEAEELIKRYGGIIKKNVIKKLHYLIVGEDPGKSKSEKAKQYRIKCITEDDLLDMIRASNPEQVDFESNLHLLKQGGSVAAAAARRSEKTAASTSTSTAASTSPSTKRTLKIAKATSTSATSTTPSSSTATLSTVSRSVPNLWVEKYRPDDIGQILGNNTHIQRMVKWLKNWESNHLQGRPSTPGDEIDSGKGRGKKKTMSKVETLELDISTKKSVLISGIPGIGKTSAARAVCNHCDYDFVELNASDTRSKRSLKEAVEGMVTNRSLSEYFTSATQKNARKRKICLIMDEVDGMSGDDRGGLAELVQMIKETQIPIICICNDHSNQKLKTLINYCMDLQFARPHRDTIVKRISEICAQEGVQVDKNAIIHLLDSLGGDIRSVLNNLQLISKTSGDISYISAKVADPEKTSKQTNIFDVTADVFRAHKDYKLAMDNYFYDTMLVPALVQENYINMRPAVPNLSASQRIKMLSAAAESMSDGDTVGRHIYREQQWTLAPSHSHLSVVYPGYVMRGNFEAQRTFDRYYRFPASLGKLSTTNKNLGLIGQMQKASALRASGTRTDILLDYLPVWKHTLLEPVMRSGRESIDESINRMNEYDLTREDLESINELSIFDKKTGKNTWKDVPTAVKMALTREYNKRHAMISKARRTKTEMKEDMIQGEDEDDEMETEDSQQKSSRTIDEFAKEIKLQRNMEKFDKRRAKSAAKGKGKQVTKKAAGSTSSKRKRTSANANSQEKESEDDGAKRKRPATRSSGGSKKGRLTFK